MIYGQGKDVCSERAFVHAARIQAIAAARKMWTPVSVSWENRLGAQVLCRATDDRKPGPESKG